MSDEAFEEACAFFFKILDINLDQRLQFSEFKTLYLAVIPHTVFRNYSEVEWQQVFDIYDEDHSHHISWSEFWSITQFRENFSEWKSS